MLRGAILDWTRREFIAYLCLRTVVWTLLIYFTQPNLTLDVLEHLAWGREWQWVYPIHPGLPAWLNESVNIISGGNQLALSALSPLAASATVFIVYLLATDLCDDRRRATIIACSTEGIIYFNVLAVEFNHNFALLFASALLCLITYRAFYRGGVYWFAAGFTAALAMHAKYAAVLTLFALLLWSVWSPTARRCYRERGPYIALTVFATAWLLPSAHSLFLSEFGQIQYALRRAGQSDGGGVGWQHLTYPLKFFGAQVVALLPAILLCRLAVSQTTFTPPLKKFPMSKNLLSPSLFFRWRKP